MRRSVRLKVVLDLAERKEKEARESMIEAKKNLDDQLAQLVSLKDYHRQYMANLKQSMTGTVAITRLQSYQGFIGQVEKAVEHQVEVVAQFEANYDQKKLLWLQCRDKAKGMADLIERYRFEELVQEEKKAAKLLEDDLTSRRLRS